MKRNVIILFLTGLMLLTFTAVSVQGQEELPLSREFSSLKIREQYNQPVRTAYYRFSPDIRFFEPIDLSYFPHEKWNKDRWALLGRWTADGLYNQIIYMDTPAASTVMHGTDTGSARGYLNDFYLYIVMFVTDNYPKDTGSCYVYYSDSLLIGFKESKGILIDPESGIYQATNSYGGTKHATYNPNTINHQFELLVELDPADYAITPQDAETSSVGAAEFPHNNWNEQFLKDWNTLNEIYRPDSFSPVKAYRIEVIRRNGVSEIFINGIAVAALEDNIAAWNEKNIRVPEKVSWTFGPVLNEGGLTVTCSTGDFYLYGTGK